MAIELAIRQWARSDAAASATVENVDAVRLSNVAQLYRRLGWSAEEARARAVLLYAFIFGQSLIFLGPSLRKRASMTAACAEILIDVPAFDAEDLPKARCDLSGSCPFGPDRGNRYLRNVQYRFLAMVRQRVRQPFCNRAAGCTAHPRSAPGQKPALPCRSIAVRFTPVSGIDSRSQALPGRAIRRQ